MATYTDSFDGASTDLTWVSARGSAVPVVNGDGTASIGGTGWEYARAEGDTGSPDMYAEVVVDSNATGEILLFVRGDPSTNQTYFSAVLSMSESWMTFLEWAGSGPPVGGGPIGTADEPVAVPAAPFTFRYEAEGSTLRGYLNGVLVKTETRSGTAAGGYGGLGVDARTGSSAVRFDEWRTGALSDPPPATTAAEAQGWGDPLPVSDEFDVPGPPDPTKWSVYGAGGDVGGDECWVGHDGNGRRCVSQATVTSEGYLRITGTAGGDTGAMSHRFDQQYGRWEVRARALAAPGATGNPYHAVLIVWPWSNKWPVHGEYDFWEVNVGDTGANAWLHYPHPSLPDGHIEQERAQQAGVDVADWHNYALEWTPDELIGYIDGQEWFRFADGAGPNGRGDIQGMPAGHLTIQLDNFFPDGGLQDAYLDVEWARIYAPPVPGPGVRVPGVGDVTLGGEVLATAEELGSGITARSWTVTDGPAAVGSVLSTATTLAWSPPLPGRYEIEYSATNTAGSSADQLRVTVLGPEPGRGLLAL